MWIFIPIPISPERCSHCEHSNIFRFFSSFFMSPGRMSNFQTGKIPCYANNFAQLFGFCFWSIPCYLIHLPQKCRLTHFCHRTQSSLPHITVQLIFKKNNKCKPKNVHKAYIQMKVGMPVQNFVVNKMLHMRSIINARTIGISTVFAIGHKRTQNGWVVRYFIRLQCAKYFNLKIQILSIWFQVKQRKIPN